jgi:hypothetical protein
MRYRIAVIASVAIRFRGERGCVSVMVSLPCIGVEGLNSIVAARNDAFGWAGWPRLLTGAGGGLMA